MGHVVYLNILVYCVPCFILWEAKLKMQSRMRELMSCLSNSLLKWTLLTFDFSPHYAFKTAFGSFSPSPWVSSMWLYQNGCLGRRATGPRRGRVGLQTTSCSAGILSSEQRTVGPRRAWLRRTWWACNNTTRAENEQKEVEVKNQLDTLDGLGNPMSELGFGLWAFCSKFIFSDIHTKHIFH